MTGERNTQLPSNSHKERHSKLVSLEAGRGLAATAVVLSHAANGSDAFTPGNYGSGFHWGALGVDFFFVLSGFIIYFVHYGDPPGFRSARAFLGKRMRRVYIPYLPIGVFMAVAYTCFPDLSRGESEWGWLSTITLLPVDEGPALSVAWTLVYEMIFYFAFLLFFFVRRFAYLMCAWALGVVIANSLSLLAPETSEPLRHVFNYHILEFLAGMVVAHLFLRSCIPDWRIALAVSFILIGIYIAVPDAHRVVFGFGLAPLVLMLADWERRKKPQFPKMVVLMGAASYAIYLVHNPIISLAGRLFEFLDSWVLMFLTLVVAGLSAGIAYHLTFERPALRFASRGKVGPQLSRHGVV